jgi:hypothetical protein
MEYKSLEDKIRERAYFKYEERLRSNQQSEPLCDWLCAEAEQKVEEKIREEAYLHYLSFGDYPLLNWLTAKAEINDRIKFLAYNMHEANYNRSAKDNWCLAEKLYVEQF